jgi:hypothetical protein
MIQALQEGTYNPFSDFDFDFDFEFPFDFETSVDLSVLSCFAALLLDFATDFFG